MKPELSLNAYQQLAQRTLQPLPSNHFFTQSAREIDYMRNTDLVHAVLGVSGEAGELVDSIKKSMYYGKALDVINLREEAGDLLWYIAGPLCRALGCTLEELALENASKLRLRYPDNYTDKAALERLDKLADKISLG